MVSKFFLIFSTLLSLGVSAAASPVTSYSHLLQRIQQTYLKNAATYPILIMDRDDLEWRFAKANALKKQDAKIREGIIQKYVLEKTGIAITTNAAANFEPYLTVIKDSAIAMPALTDDFNSQSVAMCAVFPPDANRNKRLETERILQLTTSEIYGSQGYDRLKATMTYDDYVLFSLLHESGHCMDRFFFPQVYRGDDDPSTIHLSESYAETMAVFLMALEGKTDVANTRAYLRDIYSYFMEPFFAAHPENGFGSPAFARGGLIYHLSPSILAAQVQVQTRLAEIKTMPLWQIQNLAADVVNKNAFQSRLIAALYASYSEGRAVALQRYQDYASQMPDLFVTVLAQLKDYMVSEDSFKAGAFSQPSSAPVPPETQLLPVNYAKLCALLQNQNYGSLLTEVEVLRQDLRAGHPKIEAQRERFVLLSNLWSSLPDKCAAIPSSLR